MLMWKPTGHIQHLAARSTPLAIAPGRSKNPLLLSTHFSAKSELNDFLASSTFQLKAIKLPKANSNSCMLGRFRKEKHVFWQLLFAYILSGQL